MIPADQTASVIFHHESGQEREKAVIAWDDDGQPLVIDQAGLRRAVDFGVRYTILEDPLAAGPVVGVVPGGGWLITCTNEDGSQVTSPIVLWVVHADGTSVPIGTDERGITTDATRALGEGYASYRIHHPDQVSAPAPAIKLRPNPDCPKCEGYGVYSLAKGEYDERQYPGDAPARKCDCHSIDVSEASV